MCAEAVCVSDASSIAPHELRTQYSAEHQRQRCRRDARPCWESGEGPCHGWGPTVPFVPVTPPATAREAEALRPFFHNNVESTRGSTRGLHHRGRRPAPVAHARLAALPCPCTCPRACPWSPRPHLAWPGLHPAALPFLLQGCWRQVVPAGCAPLGCSPAPRPSLTCCLSPRARSTWRRAVRRGAQQTVACEGAIFECKERDLNSLCVFRCFLAP